MLKEKPSGGRKGRRARSTAGKQGEETRATGRDGENSLAILTPEKEQLTPRDPGTATGNRKAQSPLQEKESLRETPIVFRWGAQA